MLRPSRPTEPKDLDAFSAVMSVAVDPSWVTVSHSAAAPKGTPRGGEPTAGDWDRGGGPTGQ